MHRRVITEHFDTLKTSGLWLVVNHFYGLKQVLTANSLHSIHQGHIFLTLETGISANFDVRRNVVPPWRVRQAHSGSNSPMTSQNVNAKQSRKVASRVRFKHFLHILVKNGKNNQTPHWGRDSGIPSSCLRFATSTTRQASSWIANLRHSEGIPSSLPQCGVRFY